VIPVESALSANDAFVDGVWTLSFSMTPVFGALTSCNLQSPFHPHNPPTGDQGALLLFDLLPIRVFGRFVIAHVPSGGIHDITFSAV